MLVYLIAALSWIWTSRPLHMARIVHQSAGFSTIQCRCYITSYPVSHWNLILALHHLQVQVFSEGSLNCQSSNHSRYIWGTNSLIRSNTVLHLKAISYNLTFCRSAIENEVWSDIENEIGIQASTVWWGATADLSHVCSACTSNLISTDPHHVNWEEQQCNQNARYFWKI